MSPDELTAEYICKDKERLQVALHVYEAMPAVRKHLIEDVFKSVGDEITKRLEDATVNTYDQLADFYTDKTGDFYVYAEAKHGRGQVLDLVVGVYPDPHEKVDKAELDEIQERFKTKGDLERWSYGECIPSRAEGTYAYVHPDYEVARWDQDNFLRRAILHHGEFVSAIAELLVRTYEGLFVSP